MRDEKRQTRMREIEAVAYCVLRSQGYDGTSMLSVAKAAKASNETLYRWYGDKNGLFLSMVRANAAQVRQTLEGLLAADGPPVESLMRIAPALLEMLLGEKAIALNRAAAADASGVLGQAIARGGRDDVLPLIETLMKRAVEAGHLKPPTHGSLGPLFMHLLVGDQQIRRVIGTLDVPAQSEILQQADVAMAQFLTLCRP